VAVWSSETLVNYHIITICHSTQDQDLKVHNSSPFTYITGYLHNMHKVSAQCGGRIGPPSCSIAETTVWISMKFGTRVYTEFRQGSLTLSRVSQMETLLYMKLKYNYICVRYSIHT